ncbi:MAG: SLBB domain-containing protein [Rubricoccaceae bacterium]
MRPAVLVALALFALAPAAHAQQFGRVDDRETNVTSYYYHYLPGESTTRVYVWGTVRAPGLYEVSSGTDMGELLALAGGPIAGALPAEIERTMRVRLYRAEGAGRTLLYDALIEDFLAAPGRYPDLRDGDIVEVETQDRRRWGWRDTATIIGSSAGLAAVLLQILSIATR